jgi:hypothetical protein
VKRTALAYVLAIGLVAWWMATRLENRPRPPEEPLMRWSEVEKDIVVEAKPAGVWTWAVDYVKGPALILIEAAGTWTYARGATCGPDGDLNAVLSAQHAMLPSAPIGALLVKIGGSTAGVNDGVIRVGGSRAVIAIDDKVSGPLLLTINDEITGLADNAGNVKVTVSMALSPSGARQGDATPQP